MLNKLGLVDLIAAIQKKVEENTGMRCYDEIPKNAPSPLYFVEVVGIRPENTKTMWCEVYTVVIHAIAKPNNSNVEIYEMIQKLQEALTEYIRLPESVELLIQTNQGLQSLTQDETKEKHAVLAYDFKVSYGFKCKI